MVGNMAETASRSTPSSTAAIQHTHDYTIQLPAFEGPLDLLLRLIEREELDITTIALAQVADQYVSYVRTLTNPDPAALSAFLTVAAKLLLIKSRVLLPRPAPPRNPDDPPDEGEELARQLREYQQYKRVAGYLQTFQNEGRRLFIRTAPPPTLPPARWNALDNTLTDLIGALQRRLQLQLPFRPDEIPLPTPKIVTVGEMAERIRERLTAQAWISFDDLLSLEPARVEIIVALWTVLELLKRRAIVVEQLDLFGPIMLGRGSELDKTLGGAAELFQG
jgi:segregation and condensation protein A